MKNKKLAKNQRFTIKVDENNPPTMEVLATAIIELSDAAKKFVDGPVSDRVIHMILHDMTGVRITDIKAILNALPMIKHRYLKS